MLSNGIGLTRTQDRRTSSQFNGRLAPTARHWTQPSLTPGWPSTSASLGMARL